MNRFSDSFQNAASAHLQNTEEHTRIGQISKEYEKRFAKNKSRFQNWEQARHAASAIKTETIDHLDRYLETFLEAVEAHGVKIFFARHGGDARDYILDLAQAKHAKTAVTSKSKTLEEIYLSHALEQRGIGKTAPSENFTMTPDNTLRQKCCVADIGIGGVDFAIAETGTIAICSEESDAPLITSLPKTYVAVMGLEKLIPKLEDLSLFLPLRTAGTTGRLLAHYNTFLHGPRQPGETDGPEEVHLVILDNRRTGLLRDAQQRDALHCIHCNACLNVCPVFKNIGSHAYGTTYQGPIGSVITPHLRSLQSWKHLSFASSLCGACTEACPVGIDLHHHLRRNRRNATTVRKTFTQRLLFAGFTFVMRRPAIFALVKKIGRRFDRFHHATHGSGWDPFSSWTSHRELPVSPPKSFRDLWNEREKKHE